jgi:hypothetical protein
MRLGENARGFELHCQPSLELSQFLLGLVKLVRG